MIDAAGIRRLLPHRYPILLVDRVTQLVAGQRLTALKAVTGNEPWYAEVAPGTDLAYPPTLLIESWVQAAAVLVASSNTEQSGVMLLGSMSGVTFSDPVFPGDVVTHRVRVFRALSDTVIFEGDSTVYDRPAMTVQQAVLAFRPAAQIRPSTTEELT